MPSSIPNFKHLNQVVVKQIFSYCLCIAMLQNQKPLAQDHFGPSDRGLNKLHIGPLGKPNFKHQRQVVLKKKIFEYFPPMSMI